MLELHIHGGPAVIRAVLTAISTLHTPSLPVRYAQPGEFTRRAFLADRMSLPQIEALGDTLTAETEEQRRISVAGTRSGLAARYDSWRAQLLSARGELEALIDFSEDQHFDESPAELASNVAQLVRGLARVMDLHVANAVRGELLRAGIKLSLIGAPNVGKSSLLNQIVGRRAAIVSAQAGTTRDVVEVGVDLGGFFCRLGDTAGLRRTNEAGAIKTAEDFVGDIEAEGIRRAKERAMESDVVVLVASVEETDAGNHEVHFDSDVLETAQGLLQQGTRVVVAINKIDRLPNMNLRDITDSVTALLPNMAPSNIFPISCRLADESPSNLASSSLLSPTTASTPISSLDPGHMQLLLTGLTSLFRTMTSAVLPPAPSSADAHAEETTDPADSTFRAADASTYADALSATARQRNLLEACMRELQTFLSLVDASNGSVTNSHSLAASDERGGDVVELDLVLAAESLRAAASCLAQITGKGGDGGDVEEVLGVVFERCVILSPPLSPRFCQICFRTWYWLFRHIVRPCFFVGEEVRRFKSWKRRKKAD